MSEESSSPAERLRRAKETLTRRPSVFPRPFNGVPIAVITYTDEPVTLNQMREIDKKAQFNWVENFTPNSIKTIVTVEKLDGVDGVVTVASLPAKRGARISSVIQRLRDGEIDYEDAVSKPDVEELAVVVKDTLEGEGVGVTKQEITLG